MKARAEDWLNVDDHKPEATGWYAVMVCWCSEEGPYSTSRYWDGEWPDEVYLFLPQRFDTEREASDLADENELA